MKALIVCVAVAGIAASLSAQTPTSANDANLPGLTTPTVLGKSVGSVGVQVNAFGGTDKLIRTGFSLGYGFGCGFEADLLGTFARNSSLDLGSVGNIGYGGSSGELLIKYRLPISFDASIEAGLDDSNTPAQPAKVATVVGVSAGFPIAQGLSGYINPKLIALQSNTLVGISLGATYKIDRTFSIFGDWTPLVSGDNTLSSSTGDRQRVSLYSAGIRINNLAPKLDLDLAVTNATGQTTGFSLTPNLGNTAGLYAGISYRF
jgi:hypothetical protein